MAAAIAAVANLKASDVRAGSTACSSRRSDLISVNRMRERRGRKGREGKEKSGTECEWPPQKKSGHLLRWW